MYMKIVGIGAEKLIKDKEKALKAAIADKKPEFKEWKGRKS